MDLATQQWLLSADGQALLAAATEAYVEADADAVAAVTRLRRQHAADPEHTAAAMTIVRLRVKGVDKFGDDAVRMYFTPDALKQATRRRVAEHRAARLAAARPDSVVDLGCGVGGDLIAMARAGHIVAGVEADPVRAAMAEANLTALGLPGAVLTGDAEALDLRAFAVAFADPARRGGKGRSFRPEDWTPPWTFVTGLLKETHCPSACVKVAPGIPHALLPDDIEAEWVSELGEVKEAALWSPSLASCRRRATVLGAGGLATLDDTDDPYPAEERPVREVGEFLYEPDGAVIRAGLVTAVAAGVQGGLIDPKIAYVTSDASYRTPFAKGYRVIEQLPYREKPLRQALRERGIGALTIKKRGVDVVPEQLRKRLDLRGEQTATLVLTRVGGTGTALLVQPF